MMDISSEKLSQINEAALAIASQFGDKLEQVILHGSQANGHAHAESDYDFGVILSANVGKPWDAEIKAQELAEIILKAKVDLCVITRQTIEHNKPLHLNIEAKILTGGVIIVRAGAPTQLDTLKLDAADRMMRACAINMSNSTPCKVWARQAFCSSIFMENLFCILVLVITCVCHWKQQKLLHS